MAYLLHNRIYFIVSLIYCYCLHLTMNIKHYIEKNKTMNLPCKIYCEKTTTIGT